MMGETEKAGFQTFWNAPSRGLKVAAVMLSVGLTLSAGAAWAGDDEEQPSDTFEQGIIKNIMRGLGGQSMEDSHIEYRERSPLVVPSKTDLPPPMSKKGQPVANWPKDPDEQARREAIEASKKGPVDEREASRPLMPSELAMKPVRKKSSINSDVVPGESMNPNPILSPSQMGFNNGMFSKVFGGNKEEAVQFKSEPTRDSLTMPPTGYQTPSPNYKYGSGPLKGDTHEQYNPVTDKGEVGR